MSKNTTLISVKEIQLYWISKEIYLEQYKMDLWFVLNSNTLLNVPFFLNS